MGWVVLMSKKSNLVSHLINFQVLQCVDDDENSTYRKKYKFGNDNLNFPCFVSLKGKF